MSLDSPVIITPQAAFSLLTLNGTLHKIIESRSHIIEEDLQRRMNKSSMQIHLHAPIQESSSGKFGPMIRMMSMIISYDNSAACGTFDIGQDVFA
jgi:hypothetical protein